MTNEHNNIKYRPIPEKVLSLTIASLRKQRRWTQQKLAEASGRDIRTIQRVESKGIAHWDTKRDIAGAFELEDIDIFNKPVRISDEKECIEECGRTKKETVVLNVEKITEAKKLLEITETAEGYQFDSIGVLSEKAAKYFAEFEIYLRDHQDIFPELTSAQKQEVIAQLRVMLGKLQKEGVSIGIAFRKVKTEAVQDYFFLRINYYIAAPGNIFPKEIIAQKFMRIEI